MPAHTKYKNRNSVIGRIMNEIDAKYSDGSPFTCEDFYHLYTGTPYCKQVVRYALRKLANRNYITIAQHTHYNKRNQRKLFTYYKTGTVYKPDLVITKQINKWWTCLGVKNDRS